MFYTERVKKNTNTFPASPIFLVEVVVTLKTLKKTVLHSLLLVHFVVFVSLRPYSHSATRHQHDRQTIYRKHVVTQSSKTTRERYIWPDDTFIL